MPEDQSPLPCEHKIAFDTKKQAAAAALTAQYQHGAKVHPYICQYCQLWHLASHYRDNDSY